MNRFLKKALKNFLKIFLDDFTMYSDIDIFLTKRKLCFQKCKEFGTSLNLDKRAFMIF
jgi:hypothetical protein